MTEDQIKQKWRELGFFCELDDQKKTWTLTGSRARLLFFPDVLLGYVNRSGKREGRKSKALRGTPDPRRNDLAGASISAATRFAAPRDACPLAGSLRPRRSLPALNRVEDFGVREEFADDSPYTLVLDVRADGFDPHLTDRERLGATSARAFQAVAGGIQMKVDIVEQPRIVLPESTHVGSYTRISRGVPATE